MANIEERKEKVWYRALRVIYYIFFYLTFFLIIVFNLPIGKNNNLNNILIGFAIAFFSWQALRYGFYYIAFGEQP